MSHKKRSNTPKGFKGFKLNIYWIYGIIAIIFFAMNLPSFNSTEKITETSLLSKIENREVKKIIFVEKPNGTTTGEVELINKSTKPPHLLVHVTDVKDLKEQIRLKESDGYEVEIDGDIENDWFGGIISWILPLVIFIVIWIFIMRRMSGGGTGAGGQIFNIGKTKGKLIDKENIKITFEDVAGLEEAKEEVTEIVDFLKSPEKYTKLGGKFLEELCLLALQEQVKLY